MLTRLYVTPFVFGFLYYDLKYLHPSLPKMKYPDQKGTKEDLDMLKDILKLMELNNTMVSNDQLLSSAHPNGYLYRKVQ
ncbi:unnamed protein product [Moneuplotes crassus]|uniref:Uncharacterized protein n=1 Tax=Euplotes crassus TaxID=5936 RepID=A0AAD1Y4N9_EUPCR|nr:unnamed protein product [Moneuplotes crassus]